MILLLMILLLESPVEPGHWTALQSGSQAGFRGLSLPSEKVIWVSGTQNTVLRSVDGGHSWQTFKVGPAGSSYDFRDIWALDDQVAWAMGAGSGKNSVLFSTKDGGQTWVCRYVNEVPQAFFDGFHFSSEEQALLYSDPVGGAFYLLALREGQWAPYKPLAMPVALPNEASFAASGTGLFALGKHVWFGTGGATTARVFHSQDGGAHWTVANTPIRAGVASAGVFSLCFRNEQIGVAVGGKYDDPQASEAVAATTQDGGASWTLSKTGPRGFRSCVVQVPGREKTFLAVGTSGADLSLDDGFTWGPLGTPSLNVVAFSPEGVGVGAGPDGLLYRLVWR